MKKRYRMGRTTVQQRLDERSQDFRYYKEKGWFESDYFIPPAWIRSRKPPVASSTA